MNKIYTALFIVLLLFSPAIALTENDYRELLKDSEFINADNSLKKSWNEAKNKLSQSKFQSLKESQMQWAKIIRDELAQELIDFQGYSKLMAYISVTNDRADYIRSLLKENIATGIISEDNEFITVVAQGSAENKREALENAYTEAVRIAVGMIISGKTELNNDELSENIIMHSRGVIENFTVLDEITENNLIELYIQAKVHKEILHDQTKKYLESKTLKADTESTLKAQKLQFQEHQNSLAKQSTLQTKQKSGTELLKELFDKYNPEDFLSAELNPKIFYNEKNNMPYIKIINTFNNDLFWNEFIPKIHEIMNGIALKKEHHFYADKIRKANQSLTKNGNIHSGGVYWDNHEIIPFSWAKDNEKIYKNKDNSGVYPHQNLFTLEYRWENEKNIMPRQWKAVIPNDNASFTVYDLPVEFSRHIPVLGVRPIVLSNEYTEKFLLDYYEAFNHKDFKDSQGIVNLWSKFAQKMSASINYVIDYINKNGEKISIQPIKAGKKFPVVYRSIFHDKDFYGGYVYERSDLFYMIPACMAVAPGFISNDKHDLFVKSDNIYEVELTHEELEELDTMKFQVIFE